MTYHLNTEKSRGPRRGFHREYGSYVVLCGAAFTARVCDLCTTSQPFPRPAFKQGVVAVRPRYRLSGEESETHPGSPSPFHAPHLSRAWWRVSQMPAFQRRVVSARVVDHGRNLCAVSNEAGRVPTRNIHALALCATYSHENAVCDNFPIHGENSRRIEPQRVFWRATPPSLPLA